MKLCAAILIVFIISASEARPGDRLRDRVSRARWTRTVDGNDVREFGFAVADKSVVVVRSRFAATMYDFSSPTPVVAIRLGPGCIIVPDNAGMTFQSQDFTAAANELSARNGSTISGAPLTQVQLDVTARQEPTSIPPSVERFCRRSRRVVVAQLGDATFPAPGGEAEGQILLNVNSLDTEVTILAEPLIGGQEGLPRPPAGFGGRFGGRRG